MSRSISLCIPVAAIVIAQLFPGTSKAARDDPEVARIAAAGHSLKWNWVPPGKSERYGHAEVLINANAGAVRAAVADFAHYKDLVPDKFHNAHVIAKENGHTDVYMQVPVLRGMVVLWDVARFSPMRCETPGTDVLEGRMVRGNVRAMNAIWTVRTIDESWTLLKFDLLLLPNIPAPQSAIDEELRDAALQAVDAIHDRAQGHSRWIAWNGSGGRSATALPAEGVPR
jgi:hypothetical protein